VDCIEYDVLLPKNQRPLPTLLNDCQAVLHIATSIPRDPGAPGAWEMNTRLRTDGTRSLLNAALAAGVECYLQQSIVMAYPDRSDEWITEDTPLDTSSQRAGITRPVIMMENLLRAVSPQRLRWCILRGGAFVGPGTAQEDEIMRLHSGEAIIAGDGLNFFSPIHVADMATACAAALRDALAGSIFNIVDEPLRQGEYLDRLAELIGAPPPRRDPAQPRPPSWRCSNIAARAILHWQPTHSIWPAELAH
jgi:nucleoside-diphosphate-sugar epimerase